MTNREMYFEVFKNFLNSKEIGSIIELEKLYEIGLNIDISNKTIIRIKDIAVNMYNLKMTSSGKYELISHIDKNVKLRAYKNESETIKMYNKSCKLQTE